MLKNNRLKETYDRKHLQSELPKGSEVLLENTAQKQCKGGKLDDAWLGPYTIHRHLGKGIYELANEKGKILKKKVNINRLKPFKRRLPQSNPDSDVHPPDKRVKIEEPDAISSDEESEEETPAVRINVDSYLWDSNSSIDLFWTCRKCSMT